MCGEHNADHIYGTNSISTLLQCIIGPPEVTAGEARSHAHTTAVSIGLVHRGFCDYYKSLAEQGLPDQVVALANQYPSYMIYTTGHSLGGAAATLAAADLSLRFQVPRERLQLYLHF